MRRIRNPFFSKTVCALNRKRLDLARGRHEYVVPSERPGPPVSQPQLIATGKRSRWHGYLRLLLGLPPLGLKKPYCNCKVGKQQEGKK